MLGFIILPFFFQTILSQGGLIAGISLLHDGIDAPYGRVGLSAEFLKSGVFPLWNPYIYCGYPLLANAQPGSFYPIDILLFLCFPAAVAHNASLFLHIFLIGVFTYLYTKSLDARKISAFFSAAVLILSSFVVFHISSLARVRPMPWLPAAFFLIEKYLKDKNPISALMLGCVFGLQLLSGYYSFAVYSIFFAGLYLFIRGLFQRPKKDFLRHLSFLGTALLIGLGLSAVQNLPTLELFRLSSRSLGTDSELIFDNSMSPHALLTFFYPWTNGRLPDGFDMQTCMYLGTAPLFLCLWAVLKIRNGLICTFLSLCAIAFFLALGENNPFFTYALEPLFFIKYIGRSYRTLYIATFILAVLAGLGLDIWIKASAKKGGMKPKLKLFGVAVIVLTVSELWFFSNHFFDFFRSRSPDKRSADFYPPVTGFLSQQLADQRIFSVRDQDRHMVDLLEADNNIRFRIKSATGLIEFPLPEYDAVKDRMDPEGDLTFLRLASVKYILSDRVIDNPLLKQTAAFGDILVYEVPGALDRFRVAPYAIAVENYREAVERIADGDIDFTTTVTIEKPPMPTELPDKETDKSLSDNRVKVIRETSQKADLEVAVKQPSFLVISDLFYPGWKVRVNGKEENIYRANGAFRAVFLRPGRNFVRLWYTPSSFAAGVLISSVFLVLTATLFMVLRKKKRYVETGFK